MTSPAAEAYRHVVHALEARGLVSICRTDTTIIPGFARSLIRILRLMHFPTELASEHDVYTTPEGRDLLEALSHAQRMWPLQNMEEILNMIGLDGLRAYSAAWRIDAEDTDLAALLHTMARTTRRQTRRRR